MTAYLDPELADCLSIAMRQLVEIERKMDKVRGVTLSGDREESVHDIVTGPLVLWSAGEPSAVVRMEDCWPEANIAQDEDERKVLELASLALVNPGHWTVREGNLVRK